MFYPFNMFNPFQMWQGNCQFTEWWRDYYNRAQNHNSDCNSWKNACDPKDQYKKMHHKFGVMSECYQELAHNTANMMKDFGKANLEYMKNHGQTSSHKEQCQLNHNYVHGLLSDYCSHIGHQYNTLSKAMHDIANICNGNKDCSSNSQQGECNNL